MKTNILGTEYSVEIDDTLEKTNADGMCKGYDKEISIRRSARHLKNVIVCKS